ncbi:MAG: HdeD family acid-resistance protein [Pseudonocardia sp.]
MSVPTTSAPQVAGGTPTVPIGKGQRIAGVVLGLLTILYGLLVLSLRPTALLSIAVLAAIALFAVGIAQLFLARTVAGGWRWLAYLGGVLVIIGGFLALFRPVTTLFFLALVLAWSFVLNGIVRIVSNLADRRELWWLGFLFGILELLIGLWAIGSPGRELLLLVNLTGFFLFVAGIDAIVAALSGDERPASPATAPAA